MHQILVLELIFFLKLIKDLQQLMKDLDYQISISETHHLEKLDSPSGTAITIK